MASESPLIRDGAQTTAGADLSAKQYFIVALSTSTDRKVVLPTSTGQQVYGVLQNKPVSGEVADVGILGVTKVIVGSGGSTRGTAQMTDSTGHATDWTSTGNKAQIGYALESGVSGQIISMTLVPTGNTTA